MVARGFGAPRAVARRRAAAHRRADPARRRAPPGSALAALRKVKSEAKLSMRTEITAVELAVPAALRPGVESALGDIRAAGRVTGTLDARGRRRRDVRGARRRPGPPGAEGLTCASSGRRPWSSWTPPTSIPGLLADRLLRDPDGVFAERLVDGTWTRGDGRRVRRRGHRGGQGARRARHRARRPRRDHVPHALRVDPARLRLLGGRRARRARLRDVVGRAGPLDHGRRRGPARARRDRASTPPSSRRSATTCPG